MAWPLIFLRAASVSGFFGGETGQAATSILVLFAQFSPSVAAFILVRRHAGAAASVGFLKRAFKRPSQLNWLWLALVLPVTFVLVTVLVTTLFIETPDFPSFAAFLVAPLYLLALLIGFLLGGLSEEYGWRGYLQPVLQQQQSALVAALIVGVCWVIWHLDPEVVLPTLFTDGPAAFAQAAFESYAFRFLLDIPTAIIMVWLFNSTKGNLLTIILYHVSGNAAQTVAVNSWSAFPVSAEIFYGIIQWVFVIGLLAIVGTKTLSKNEGKWTSVLTQDSG